MGNTVEAPDVPLAKLTLSVPEDVIEAAKLRAVKQKTSVSKVVTECLRRYAAGEPVPDPEKTAS